MLDLVEVVRGDLDAKLLVLAGSLGLSRAAGAVLAYVGQGALRLPVLATGSGLAYMAGPTGGFLLCAALVGGAVDRGAGRHWLVTLAMGHALTFVSGVLWLATFTGLNGAWAAGAAPFLLGTVVKTVLASMLLAAGRGLVAYLREG